MGQKEVSAPGGGQWRVRRRVLAWRPRRRMGFEVDPAGVLLGALGVLLLGVEWLVVLLVTAALAASRGAGLRPWQVEAVLEGPMERRMAWSVKGWGAAGETAERVREELVAGRDPATHADRVTIRPRL